jgi:predicted nuclease of restriction endonuclease-like (RecB) superfamily
VSPPYENPRKHRGRAKADVTMPVPVALADMPPDYGQLLSELKQRVGQERVRAVLSANVAMVLLYWDVGQTILARQQMQGWGARVIDRLSHDLKTAFPAMSGFSPRNLKYMRLFASAWPDRSVVQRTVAQLPWRTNLTLLEKLDDPEHRLWYADKALEQGLREQAERYANPLAAKGPVHLGKMGVAWN